MDFNLFKIYSKIVVKRNEFKIVLFLCSLLTIISFVMNMTYVSGLDPSMINAASEMWVGISGRAFRGILLFIMPIFAAVPFSDIYYDFSKSGFSNLLLTRMNKYRFLLTTGIIVFISGAVVLMIPLILNQILCLIAFPLNNSFSINTSYGIDSLFYPININSPYLYNLIYTIIISIFSGSFSVLSYIISLFYKKSRISVVLIPFVLYIIVDFTTHALQIAQYSLYYMLTPGHTHAYGLKEHYFIIIFFFLTLISICFINIKTRTDEL